MLRGPLLAAALFTLLGVGSGTGHVRDGRIAYVHVGNGNRFEIYTMTATGAHRRPLTGGRRYSSYEPAYAPRGKRIAFVRAYKQADLWTMNADGTHKRPLTSTAGIDETGPAWSPDGKQIVFSVEKPALLEGLWIVGDDGNDRRRLTNGVDESPAWSPDGSEIAFTRSDAIWVVPATGGTATQLTFPGSDSDGQPYFDAEPRWSPSGSTFIFASDRGGAADSADQVDLWTMHADGSQIRPLTHTSSRDERDPAWSPGGRWIVYSGNGTFHGASSSQIYVSRANGTKRRILTHACGECAYINDEPSWQPLR